jgi:hypothetical protein
MKLMEFTVKEGSEAEASMRHMEGQIVYVNVKDKNTGQEKQISGRIEFVGHAILDGQPAFDYALAEVKDQP